MSKRLSPLLSDRRGYVMLVALLLMGIIGIIGASTLSAAGIDHRIAHHNQKYMMLITTSHAGADHARLKLTVDSTMPASEIDTGWLTKSEGDNQFDGIGFDQNLGVYWVDAIFEKFKAGVREQISEADSATHYDLGVAYKEMGLVADAVQELELAARDAARECMCWAMIGVVRMEQGQFGEAVAAYEQGLRAANRTPDQTATLLYDLAAALELTGDTAAARARLEELVRLDSGYRDAATRLAALRAS